MANASIERSLSMTSFVSKVQTSLVAGPITGEAYNTPLGGTIRSRLEDITSGVLTPITSAKAILMWILTMHKYSGTDTLTVLIPEPLLNT